jgi:hypothetical protein
MIEPIRKTLTIYGWREAHEAAVKRRQSAIDNRRPPRNGSPDGGDKAFAIDLLGTCTERISKDYMDPIQWNAFTANPSKGIPDLQKYRLMIDVKGRSKSHYELPVQINGCHDNWAYLLVTAVEGNKYAFDIRGWCWGWEARSVGVTDPSKQNMPAYFVPQNHAVMKPPAELWKLT